LFQLDLEKPGQPSTRCNAEKLHLSIFSNFTDSHSKETEESILKSVYGAFPGIYFETSLIVVLD
jgi:hypothetical protein